MAQTMKVPGDQLRWYAAFHNESPAPTFPWPATAQMEYPLSKKRNNYLFVSFIHPDTVAISLDTPTL